MLKIDKYQLVIYSSVFLTHRSNDHMQWHRDIEIKGIIIENVGYKKHHHQIQITRIADFERRCAALGGENETFQSDECKLKE